MMAINVNFKSSKKMMLFNQNMVSVAFVVDTNIV